MAGEPINVADLPEDSELWVLAHAHGSFSLVLIDGVLHLAHVEWGTGKGFTAPLSGPALDTFLGTLAVHWHPPLD